MIDGGNFLKFVEHIYLKGYTETPEVVKVLENGIEIDKTKYQKLVNEAMEVDKSKPIDYRELSEKQADELAKKKTLIDSFSERLSKLENSKLIESESILTGMDTTATETIVIPKRSILESKANELGIKFRDNIGNDKLLLRIQGKEPKFKI